MFVTEDFFTSLAFNVPMRAIWSGSISFGLVNIPIKLYSGVESDGLSFDMLHKDDLSPIRYARICKDEDKEIPYPEIVKGYEYSKGDYIVVTEEDFQKADARKTKTIDIMDFVQEAEIEILYYEKPYYLEPEKSAAKPYALLREALRKSGKVGLGKFVLRNKEHLVIVKPIGDAIVLEQLRFFDSIRDYKELNLPSADIANDKEVDIALALIKQLTSKFKPDEYSDSYTDKLKDIIHQKEEGRVPRPIGEAPQPTHVKNLMETLKKSLEEAKNR